MKIPLYGNKKLRLAFEYGLVLAASAQQMNHTLSKELSERAEKMLVNEFKKKSATRLSQEMLPNILSVFETNMDSDTLDGTPTGDIETISPDSTDSVQG